MKLLTVYELPKIKKKKNISRNKLLLLKPLFDKLNRSSRNLCSFI